MKCKICGSENTDIIYNDLIRDGGLGQYTKKPIKIFQCKNCDVIWHDNEIADVKEYYETEEYRNELEGSSEEEKFYELHDKETLDKLNYTGTTIFRNKVVADIGCGCGAFLDYISGVAREVVAVEPSLKYRNIMSRKGFSTYSYADEAKKLYANKIDVITSFDVIEHVQSPESFIKDVYDLLTAGGKAIIGTPTDAPVMRSLLGKDYEKKLLFSTQHLWILSEKNLRIISEKCGFKNIDIKYYQRYGIDNMLGWLKDKEPKSEIKQKFITETLNNVWKAQLVDNGLADYIVLYLEK
jgi:2-polyprenyl-3-methyl-5-hydroxy-6-metoxy-1,4-benzoquinol methylase